MKLIERVHDQYVAQRRARVLSGHLARMIPSGARVLDVGCGDGSIAGLVAEQRRDLGMAGIDVLMRPDARIAVSQFDGRVIPYDDDSFDTVMFVDVLHHTEDPISLLREAVRVTRRAIVIKDHMCDGWLADRTLRLMDVVGNARHGVSILFNYWTHQRWLDAFGELNLRIGEWKTDLRIYPQPASLMLDRSLHFLTRLDVQD